MADDTQHFTLDDTWRFVKSRPLKELWSVATAFASLVTGAFWLGHYAAASSGRIESSGLLKTHVDAKGVPIAKPGSAIPCYEVQNWPKGTWVTWGHIEHNGEPFPQFSQSVVFDSNTSYITETDQPARDATKNTFRATLKEPLRPDSSMEDEGQDGTGYMAHSRGQVTADGCMINGTFTDTKGNRGSFSFLYKRDRYYVDP
jgi:hypothetical protein